MIYLYLFGTCFHFIYVFMIIGNKITITPCILGVKNRHRGSLHTEALYGGFPFPLVYRGKFPFPGSREVTLPF